MDETSFLAERGKGRVILRVQPFLFDLLVRSSSPYINQFISADTIIPNPADPQSWNRYSYVTNNPLRYTDPTGHMADYGGSEGGGGCNSITCFPQAPSNPSPGGGGGNYCSSHPGACGNNNGSNNDDEATTHTSVTITLGLSLGSTQNVPNYYGDYEFNTNVPYFPGGNTQPNPCKGSGSAYALCVFNFLTSIIPPARGPVSPSENFFLSFTLTSDGNGIGMSDIQWANHYSGTARFSQLRVNNRSIPAPAGGNYLVNDGSYYPIVGSGAYTPNGESLTVRAVIFTTINTPLGLGEKPYIITYPP